MNDSQAQINRMHVRRLINEKQPCFAAMLESIVREFALESMARDRGPTLGEASGRPAVTAAVVELVAALGEINSGEQTMSQGADRAHGSRQGCCRGPLRAVPSRVRIGALVTPLSRRRVHKVARETATLDLLSSGRLIFGAGLGSARNNELEPFGEVTDPRERARLLDHGLDALARYWAGEFEPVPVQRPRPPVWVAGEWPNRRPVRRALRWDGLFTIGLPGPEALAGLTAEIRDARPGGSPFDLITELPPDTDLAPWERAGLTWAVTDFGLQPTEAGVRAVIDAGPGLPARAGCRLDVTHC